MGWRGLNRRYRRPLADPRKVRFQAVEQRPTAGLSEFLPVRFRTADASKQTQPRGPVATVLGVSHTVRRQSSATLASKHSLHYDPYRIINFNATTQ